jgi:hypothetical protein
VKYHDVRPIDRGQAEAAFAGSDTASICDALVRVAFHDPDWRYSQSQFLEFLSHPNPEVRRLASTCLGHVARIHKKLDRNLVEVALRRLLADPEVAGSATYALEDIEMFMGKGATS